MNWAPPIAPDGLAWVRVRSQRPDLNLYAGDDRHPNTLSAYLVACVFYSAIFGRSPDRPMGLTAGGTFALANTAGAAAINGDYTAASNFLQTSTNLIDWVNMGTNLPDLGVSVPSTVEPRRFCRGIVVNGAAQ
jgi:hypothetical protein